MAVTYNDKEIQISASLQKVNIDVVYVRPEDVIRFDFDIKSVKVTFVDGDVDFIFPNGSIVSLASFATLAFSSSAPTIYDGEGHVIALEDLLENVQVTKPEDSILILANRDKSQLVQNDEYVDKVIMATINSGELQGGNPIAGVGEISAPTSGLQSPIIDKTGTVAMFNQKRGLGDYLSNNNTTHRRGSSDSENILPGNTNLVPQPGLTYNFLFGDSGILGGVQTINGNKADYYAVKFGTGDVKESASQLRPIEMNNLGGEFQNKIFDAHSVDGKIKRVLKLDYSGGIFPQSIAITGIPGDKDNDGNMIFRLWLKSGGTTKLLYTPNDNKYMLTQLDPTGKLELFFEFNDNIMDQNLNIKFALVYFDPKTSEARLMETYYDVGIRSVNQQSDLSLNSVVINKGASGIIVDANNSGSGDKIFIGGNVSNNFESNSGNNLIFSGGGNDIINVSGSGTKNVIYGSTGYNIITGSGGDDNWLIFSNDKSYNKDFLSSPAIKDSYYNTLKLGISLQFYLGVEKGAVSNLWHQLGITGDAGGLRGKETSNFIKSFNSLTVIGDRGGEISIKNIVGTLESDVFNLYFNGVSQKINIIGGNEKTIVSSRIVINAKDDDTITVVFGKGDNSSITSDKSSMTAYTFDNKSFDRVISNGKENLVVKIVYDGNKGYRAGPVYFTGGDVLKEGNKNLADFSELDFADSSGHIEFNADNKYNSVLYKGVKGKVTDYFYNFTHINGTKGNDIFFGNSNSNRYHFNGFEGSNTLSYAKSVCGITFNAADGLIYKINNPNINNISDYSKHKDRADSYEKITTIILSNIDNIVVAYGKYNIGKDNGNPELILGASNNILRYDLDESIASISVDADALIVTKKGSSEGKDIYIKKQERSGSIKYVGTKGDDTFYGGTINISRFDGKGGSNILTYERVSSENNLSFDLLRGTVSGAGKQDVYENINKLIGGQGNDDFFVGNFDPTKDDHVKKITGIEIDGGGGTNSFKFSGTDIKNLNPNDFILTFDVNTGDIKFISKNGSDIIVKIDLSKNIGSIAGTIGSDKFIASKTKNFIFDGGGHTTSDELQKKGVYGNTLDYSNFEDQLTINLIDKVILKSSNNKDIFKNIQAFISGKSDDIFILNHTMDDKIRFFNGNGGNNTLSYANNFKVTVFDFFNGKVFFADHDADKIYDAFKNFSVFEGGKGSDTFILCYDSISFNDNVANKSSILIDGGGGNNTLDFSSWGVSLGNQENPFVLASQGSIDNGKNDETKIKYEWKNINSFLGSQFGDYFVVDKSESNFFLDGNSKTKEGENNVLDYSKLEQAVNINVSTGIVSKNGNMSADTIRNINHILLTNKNDTITFLNFDRGFLPNLKIIEGNGGDNTIDFKQSTSDILANIDKKGFKLNAANIKVDFINFNVINASRGNSTFIATDESNEARVFLNGNIGVIKDKVSVLDLTQLSGNIVYNNLNLLDKPSDSSALGALTWGDNKKANIIIKDIKKVLLNNGNNLIYGSANNHTHYIGCDGVNSIDYSHIDDAIFVYIASNDQRVRFEAKGGEDKLSNFTLLKGTKKNDTFIVSDLNNISSGVEYDGFEGENTFSFVAAKEAVTIDISLAVIQVKDKTIKLKNVQNLILSNNNDVVKITETNILFNNIDGGKGDNVIDITNGGKVTFNKNNKLDLVLSNIPNKAMAINNFSTIQTNTKTGNMFYGAYGSAMTFKVIGSQSTDINILTYVNASSLVEIDFTNNKVIKGDQGDTFSGINYFFGSFHSSTFHLSKESKDNFNTIYINVSTPTGQVYMLDKSTDIISLVKLGENIKFYAASRTFEGATVKYEWDKIATIDFTNHQTIYASFDEKYKYIWRKVNTDKAEGTVLIFDTKQGKNNTNYQGGYVVVDMGNHEVNTFDSSGKQKANIDFAVINTIIGTGSEKDIFYASSDSISFQGGVESGKGTLSYKKYATQDGISITFNSDNSAVITDFSNPNKKDTAKFISRFIGTSGNDTFIIAQNKGQSIIEIDGNSGIYNKVDFSQLTSGDKGIELDTTKGIPKGDYHYLFRNISTFKLTQNNDTVLGSMGNKGFSKDGNEFTSIIIDGGGGENTLDYSVYVKGTADKLNTMNIDLQMGLITKVGYENNKSVSTNDNIAVVENGKSKINFKHIVLSGEYTINTLIVSGGNNNKDDTYINVIIKNPTKGLKQVISLENVNESLKFTWNGTTVSGSIGGKNVVYDGFNNIRLSKLDSILIIDKPVNVIDSGGSLHGGGGNNTLEISNNEANSSIILDLNLQILRFNIDGSKEYKYSLFNFQTFNLGYSKNLFIATDIGNYIVNFTKTNASNSVSYINLNSSFARLVIDGITSEGAQATLNKLSISDATVTNGIDKIFNIKDISLTNSDDIVDVKNNDNGPIISIDGKRGVNTVSFEKSWEGNVDINSISGGTINLKGYKLINFSKVILTQRDDNIKLKHDSMIQIDGGGGNNTVDYSEGTFSKSTIFINEYETVSTGNVRKIGIKVNKEGKYVDDLIRFNSITLGVNTNTMYTAYFVKQIVDNPTGFNINFNAKNIEQVSNMMDYSKMADAVNGIMANVRFENNTNLAEIWRDSKEQSVSLKDNLIGLTKILGTNKGDIFNIDTNVKNLDINAGNSYTGEINLKYIDEEAGKVFVWDLDNNTIAKGSSAQNTKVFLKFNGFKNIGGVALDNKKIDNVFMIYKFDINYNIVTQSKASSNSIITANFSNVKVNNGVNYKIMVDPNFGGALTLSVNGIGDTSKSVRLSGITYVLGNMFNVNNFSLTLSRSADNIRPYIIEGRGLSGGKLDNIEINRSGGGNNDEKINFNVISGGNLSLKQNGYANLTIKDIPLIKLNGTGEYILSFNDNSKGSNLNLVCDSKTTKIVLDFDKLIAKDYALTLDAQIILLRLNSKQITVNSNDLNAINLNKDSEGQVILRNNIDISKEKSFEHFNKIDLSELNSSKFDINIKSLPNSSLFVASINKFSFSNNKDLAISLGAKNYEIKLNIANFKDIKNNIAISSNYTSYANKSKVTITDFAASADTNMMLEIRDNLKTIFYNKTSPNKVILDNVKLLNFSSEAANWNVKFLTSYNYFLGGNNSVGLGLVMLFKANEINIDFTDFNGRKVGLEGVQATGDGNYYGYFIGFDSQLPNWRQNKALATIGSMGSSIFNSSKITLPDTGILYKITYGWLNSYLIAAKSGKVSKGITLDGSNSYLNSVEVRFDEDVSMNLSGYSFLYIVKSNSVNAAASDYTLVEAIDQSGNKIQNINFNMLNLGRIDGTDRVNSTYQISNVTPLFINGSKNSKTEVIFATKDNNKVNFQGNPIDMFINNSNLPGSVPVENFRIYGNLGGFVSTLDNIQKLDLSKITNYKNKITFTLNTFLFTKKYKYDPLIILPEASTSPPSNINGIIKHVLDFSPIGITSEGGRGVNISINKQSEIKISNASETRTNYFVVKNFYEIIPTSIMTFYFMDDFTHSYILNGGNYAPTNNSIFYRAQNIISHDASNAKIHKKNMPNGNTTGVDYYSRLSKIVYSNELLQDDADFYARGKNNAYRDGSSSELIDYKMHLDFYSYASEVKPTIQSTQEIRFDSPDLSVYISFNGIALNSNKTFININNLKYLNISGEGRDHYKVYFITNDIYYNEYGESKTFDTSGYFALVDTDSGRLVYFTGKDITKYFKAFEDFLAGKHKIEAVNSYEDMLNAIKDNNFKTNEFKPEPPKEDDVTKDNTNTDNTNHAQSEVEDIEDYSWDYEDIDIETIEYNNNSSVHSNVNRNEEPEYSNDAEWINISNLNYQEAQDSSYLMNISNDSLNVLDNEDSESSNYNSELNPIDVLESSNNTSIDSLSDSIFKSIVNDSNTEEEDNSDIINTMESLINIENIASVASAGLPLLESDNISNDPSSKVEASVNKQNTMNGNNHR